MNPIRSTIDGIDCITVTRPNATKTVMILHGFGADMNDLAPLHSQLDPDQPDRHQNHKSRQPKGCRGRWSGYMDCGVCS